jgi:hypothetical protein
MDLGLACPLYDDSGLIFAQRVFSFFVVEVDQNSFPNSPEVHSHWSQCYVLAWGSYADYHCSKVALGSRLALEFFFVALICGSIKPPLAKFCKLFVELQNCFWRLPN